jgi:hypothetical protein
LIQVLSLQVIIWSKIRLTADNLELYKKTINFNEKTESSDFLISIVKNKSSILNLIKEVQEFNLLCRWISSQFHRKSERNLSFALIKNKILKKMNHVFVLQQKMIWNHFLELYHDCFSEDYWDRNKTLKLIQHHFIWNEIADNIHVYIITCLICQSKAIHHHQSYSQLKSLSILKNTWNSSFKKINLNWITRLSLLMKTKNSQKYNSILTIVYHITKYALFILIQNNITAADFTELFFEHVECCFNFSKNIMMNRDSHIISDF